MVVGAVSWWWVRTGYTVDLRNESGRTLSHFALEARWRESRKPCAGGPLATGQSQRCEFFGHGEHVNWVLSVTLADGGALTTQKSDYAISESRHVTATLTVDGRLELDDANR